MENILVDLVDKLSKVVRTKGPSSSEFGQTLESINEEYSRISSTRPGVPSMPRANSTLSKQTREDRYRPQPKDNQL